MPQKQKKDAINANLVEKDRAGKRILYRHVVHRRLALHWKDDKMQANQWKFDSHPNIEESETVVASILRVEVLHVHFVHPNIVGLPKLESRDVSWVQTGGKCNN